MNDDGMNHAYSYDGGMNHAYSYDGGMNHAYSYLINSWQPGYHGIQVCVLTECITTWYANQDYSSSWMIIVCNNTK